MKKTWVVIADASQARVYRIDQAAHQLVWVNTFEHPQSRLKSGELTADGPGSQSAKGAGALHTAYNPRSDQHEIEKENFAKELANALDVARNDHHYDELILIAEPHFHGLLHSQLSDHVNRMVSQSIKKNYLSANERELYKLVQPKRW